MSFYSTTGEVKLTELSLVMNHKLIVGLPHVDWIKK